MVDIELQEGGWISVAELLKAFECVGQPFAFEVLTRLISTNEKHASNSATTGCGFVRDRVTP